MLARNSIHLRAIVAAQIGVLYTYRHMMCTFFGPNLLPDIIPVHNDVSNHPGCEDERCGLSTAKAKTTKN